MRHVLSARPPGRRVGRGLVAAAACAAALLLPTTAHAATAGRPAATQAYTWYKLNLTMQAQQNSEWCWAASGNTVASYFGKSYSQNQFCNMAFDRSVNSSCPNWQASLDNDQEAFGAMGLGAGYYYYGYLSYNTVINEITANRPVITRIQWSSGGGHMEVLYGYDKSNSWVYWGDPWPSDSRYNWATWSYYVSNGSFEWTHSLYQIGE